MTSALLSQYMNILDLKIMEQKDVCMSVKKATFYIRRGGETWLFM